MLQKALFTSLFLVSLVACAASAAGENVYYVAGHGIAIGSDPLAPLEARLIVATANLDGGAQVIGVLALGETKYRLSNGAYADGTVTADVSDPAGKTGAIKCSKASATGIEAICSLTVGSDSYTLYLLRAGLQVKNANQQDYCKTHPEDSRCRTDNLTSSSAQIPQECLDCRSACEGKCSAAPSGQMESCYLACSPSCKTCKEKAQATATQAGGSGSSTSVTVSSTELGQCAECKNKIETLLKERLQAGQQKCGSLSGDEQAACRQAFEQDYGQYKEALVKNCDGACGAVNPGNSVSACDKSRMECKQTCSDRYPNDEKGMAACAEDCFKGILECPQVTATTANSQNYCAVCTKACSGQNNPASDCLGTYVKKCQAYCNQASNETGQGKAADCNSQCEQRAKEICTPNQAKPCDYPLECHPTSEVEKVKNSGCEVVSEKTCPDMHYIGTAGAVAQPSEKQYCFKCPTPACPPNSGTGIDVDALSKECAAKNGELVKVTDSNGCFIKFDCKIPTATTTTSKSCPPTTNPTEAEQASCKDGGGSFVAVYDQNKCVTGYKCQLNCPTISYPPTSWKEDCARVQGTVIEISKTVNDMQCVVDFSCSIQLATGAATSCTSVVNQVCGADQHTWQNSCLADASNTQVAHAGAC